MPFDSQYRLGSHAVITNPEGKVLLLKATYGEKYWGLPGGSVDPEETVHEALLRECQEELGLSVTILYLSGIYFHKIYNAHVCIFRCELSPGTIKLSSEHSEWGYFSVDELSTVQRQRVVDCLQYDGEVRSAKFL